MPLAEHPLHRSGRAGLPHPAPTSGGNAKPDERIGMTDAEGRNPAGDVVSHPVPRESSLAAAAKRAPPHPNDWVNAETVGRFMGTA